MGGKTKQSQRTKNNVRPSSSGRSALLLSNVKLEAGIINVTGTELPALFPSLVVPNIDPLVSPELQLCIKKLNKKDPITKTKALQELSELVVTSKVDDVVAALPSWAHFYRILTVDPERKVREATQACHGAVVAACGRRLAPHLKQLVPSWLQALHDEHAPAQTNAQNSLAKTFPDSKLPEVISFCKSEVLAHLMENLIGTGESASIKKMENPEEKALQIARLVSSSLHGVEYSTSHLPREHDAWLWGHLDTLLQAPAFWKHAKHTDSKIRASWYGAVGRIIERFKLQFAERYGQKALRVLIEAKESNPLAAAQLWDCLLLFMHNVEDWYKYLDKNELLNKRILDVLENGGWGDARHLRDMLLPLLAQLPPDMLTNEFYLTFFNALFNGLEKKAILNSKSERQSWITSLDECLRYLSIQQQEYVLEVVTAVHRTWLEKILSDMYNGQIRTNLVKYSAVRMAVLVKYWLKQAKESHSEKYDQLIRNFWQNVGVTITTQIDKLSNNHADIGRAIDGHMLLLQTLKTSFIQEVKKQQSIKFDGDSLSIVDDPPKETPQCDASIVERYNHNLNDLVEKVCGHYFEFASKREISSPVLTPLKTLLVDFDSKNLFSAIARQFGCDSTYKFYEKVLRVWLAGDTMRCKAVVDVIFLFMKHLSEPEQDALFDSFKQFPPSVVEWAVSEVVPRGACEACGAARRWARGAVVAAAVRALCARHVARGAHADGALLLRCLTPRGDGEMVISESAVSEVVERLSAAVVDVHSPQLEAVARLSAALVTSLPGNALRQLVRALFQLNLSLTRTDPRLAAGTWTAVRAAWQRALRLLPGGGGGVLRGAAALAHHHLRLPSNLSRKVPPPSTPSTDEQHTHKPLDINQIEHVVSLCPYLLSNNSQQDIAEIVNFTKHMFDITPIDPALIETFVLRHDIVKGDINCPFEDGEITKIIIDDCSKDNVEEITEQNLISYTNNCTFRGIYLRTILLHKVDEDLEDSWCNVLLMDDYFVAEFCKVMHDFILVSSMFDAYAFSPFFNIIKETKQVLNNVVTNVINECTIKTRLHLLTVLSEIAAVKGFYWSFARIRFELLAKFKETDGKEEEDRLREAEIREEIAEGFKSSTESNREEPESDHATESSEETSDGSQDKPECSEAIAKGNESKSESDKEPDHQRTEYYQIIDKVEEKTESRQENIESSQNKSNQDETESRHEQTAINQEKTESNQEKAQNIQANNEFSQNKIEGSQESTEKRQSNQDTTKSSHEQTGDNQDDTESNPSEVEQNVKCNEVEKMDVENLREIITGSGFFHTIQANERWYECGGSTLRAKYLLMLRSYYSANYATPEVVGEAFLNDVTKGEQDCNADVIVNAYYAHKHTLLFEQDVWRAPWGAACSSAAAADYLTALVRARGWALPAHHWDFVTITLCNLLTAVVRSKEHWGCSKVALVARAALALYVSVARFVRGVPALCARAPPAAHVALLPREWRDVFGPDLNGNLFTLVMFVLESSARTVVTSNHVAVLDALTQCVRRSQWELVPRGAGLALERVARGGAAALAGPAHLGFKYLAYELLRALVDHMVLHDASVLEAWSREGEAREADEAGEAGRAPQFSLLYYDDTYCRLQELVLTATAHIKLCEETCALEEWSDVHGLALGWFLIAEIMAGMCGRARGHLRHHYVHLYRERGYTEPLLRAALRLLPGEVFAAALDGDQPPLRAHADLFTRMVKLNVYKYCSAQVSAAACRAVCVCVRGAGTGDARGWRGAAPHRHARLLDNIMQRYITPFVVKEEFTLLQQKASELEDMEVRVIWSSYEVICILTVEERPIEMRITLSRTHPLGLPGFIMPGNMAVGNTNWLVMYMGYQNSSLLSALQVWSAAVTRKVERSAQCYICYCRLHFGTGRLPAVQCHQCRNKFHTDCLRKWFVTSNKSNCPLCRTPF